MAEMVALVAKFSADASEFMEAVDAVKEGATQAADAIKQMVSAGSSGGGGFAQLTSGAKDFGGALADMGKGLMDTVFEAQMVVEAIKMIGEALLDPAISKQTSLQEMSDTMGGDTKAAGELFEGIEAVATALALPTDALEAVGQKMLAMGIDSNNVVPEIDAVGKAVDALGGGTDKIAQIITALNKMQDTDKVTMQAMTRLTDEDSNAWAALASGMGVSVPDAMKKVQSGTLNATDAVNDIIKGFNTLYATAGSDKVNTLSGAWQSFSDQLGKLATTVFMPLVEGLTMLLQLFNKAADAVGNLGTAIGKAFGGDGTQKVDSGTAAVQKWLTTTNSATTSTNTFDAAQNQTAQSTAALTANQAKAALGMTTTTAATTAGTTAFTQSATSTTSYAQALIDASLQTQKFAASQTDMSNAVVLSTSRFTPLDAGTKSAQVAMDQAAGSAGTMTWAMGMGGQQFTATAKQASDFAAQNAALTAAMQKTAAAAKVQSESMGTVIPGSLQDQIDNAGNGMGTLQIHFTSSAAAAKQGSDQTVQSVNDMNDAIQLFAQNNHESFGKAKQSLQDYATFTRQTMQQAITSLNQKPDPQSMESWGDKEMDVLTAFLNKVQSVAQAAGQLLGNIPGLTGGMGGNSLPAFASGVQNYTGMAIVGEDGPELVNLNGGSVYPFGSAAGGSSLPPLTGMGSGGSGGPITIQLIMDSKQIAVATVPYISSQIRLSAGRRS